MSEPLVDSGFEIENIPLDDITAYWRNPRQNADAIEGVADSIRLYGMLQPLVVDAEHVIIVGDTRFRALKGMGATHAPCIVRNLSRKDAKAYRIADNKTGELATWDIERLRSELLEIPDLDLTAWYTEGELKRLIGDASPKELVDPSVRSGAEAARRTATADQVELKCPTCEYVFYANRNDLETRPGIAAPAPATLGAEAERVLVGQAVGAPGTASTPDTSPDPDADVPRAKRQRTPPA